MSTIPERFAWIQVGVRADYHSVIGGPVTQPGLEVREAPFLTPAREWCAMLKGKAGWVACEALTPAEARPPNPECDDPACEVPGCPAATPRESFRVEPYTGPQPTTEALAGAARAILSAGKPLDGSQTCDMRVPRQVWAAALRALAASRKALQ